jgi:hypothetical protein
MYVFLCVLVCFSFSLSGHTLFAAHTLAGGRERAREGSFECKTADVYCVVLAKSASSLSRPTLCAKRERENYHHHYRHCQQHHDEAVAVSSRDRKRGDVASQWMHSVNSRKTP